VCFTKSVPGDYFGELALLPGGNTRAATVRARTDVSLLVLDRSNFESLLGPLMPQLQAAAKSYTGFTPKQGVQVCC
jgi:CRP-like cAMP-binding protein